MGVGGKGVEGMGVEDMEEEPSDVVVNHGVAPWPRLGARGASKSSLSWVIRRQTKPYVNTFVNNQLNDGWMVTYPVYLCISSGLLSCFAFQETP